MRAFGVLAYVQASGWRQSWVLVHGLLASHAAVSLALVVWGRRGFERTLEVPFGRAVVVVLASGAVVGLLLLFRRTAVLLERVAASVALVLPLVVLWALVVQFDYDGIAGAMSATSFGEQGDLVWFPGIPFRALGYSVALMAYAWACNVATLRSIDGRSQRAATWASGLLLAVSLAGVVHWATGW